MQRTKENPYNACTLPELWTACQKRAVELGQRGVMRSAAEREALAESTVFLLLAVARAVAPAEYDGSQPEQALRHGKVGVADAFAAAADKEIRNVRYHTLLRAADYVLGAKGWHWMGTTHVDGREVGAVATESDAGLRLALDLLQAQGGTRR